MCKKFQKECWKNGQKRENWSEGPFFLLHPVSILCYKAFLIFLDQTLAYISASGPLSHWRALSALSSWLVYRRKLGVSGMYWAVIKSMTGAPAQTSASWRQSNLAPIAKADKRPICDATLVAEHRLPRMEGWAISLIYNCDVSWKKIFKKKNF